jgi:hypothetical protein
MEYAKPNKPQTQLAAIPFCVFPQGAHWKRAQRRDFVFPIHRKDVSMNPIASALIVRQGGGVCQGEIQKK